MHLHLQWWKGPLTELNESSLMSETPIHLSSAVVYDNYLALANAGKHLI
jgi:hypothetical protein